MTVLIDSLEASRAALENSDVQRMKISLGVLPPKGTRALMCAADSRSSRRWGTRPLRSSRRRDDADEIVNVIADEQVARNHDVAVFELDRRSAEGHHRLAEGAVTPAVGVLVETQHHVRCFGVFGRQDRVGVEGDIERLDGVMVSVNGRDPADLTRRTRPPVGRASSKERPPVRWTSPFLTETLAMSGVKGELKKSSALTRFSRAKSSNSWMDSDVGCRSRALHDLRDEIGGRGQTDLFEVDDEVIEVGIVDIGVEDLAAPEQAMLIGLADVAGRFIAGQSHPVNGVLHAERSGCDDPHFERVCQILEEELSCETVVDPVAVGQDLGDGRLGSQQIACLSVGEPLIESRRHIEASQQLLLGHPIGFGRRGRDVLLAEYGPAELGVQQFGELGAAAADSSRDGDDRHGIYSWSSGQTTGRPG